MIFKKLDFYNGIFKYPIKNNTTQNISTFYQKIHFQII